MGAMSTTTANYAVIVPLATEAVANVQTRFPTCLGVQSGLAVVNATMVATGIFTCL